jgi:hypothetical protein
MGREFMEHTQGDTLYRVEYELMQDAYQVVGYTEIPGHEKRLGTSVRVRAVDVDDELSENGLDRTSRMNREHAALRLGMIRLMPQIAHHKRQLLGRDMLDGDFDDGDPLPADMAIDPVLKAALEQADREKKAAEEAARIAREKREREIAAMESNELWGAF